MNKRNPVEGNSTPKRKRIPVSGNRDVLTVNGKEPGFVYRWVNDTGTRLRKFQDAGYEFVQHEAEVGDRVVDSSKGTDSVTSKAVGADKATGTIMNAYLMRIPSEYYEEDQAAKQQEIDAKEASMKSEAKQTGRYGNIDISIKNR